MRLKNNLKTLLVAMGLALTPAVALAVAPVAVPAAPVAAPATATPAPAAVAPAATTVGTSKPDPRVGQPIEGQIGLQVQVTKNGEQGAWIHDAILMPMMTGICVLVLFLLLWVVARYRRAANPVASKTSHNTLIEIVWTLAPVLILVGLAVPSISLIAAQFKPAPANAVTLKAIGNQWYWVHQYPDYGVEVTSNMLTDDEAKAKGEPRLLGVDKRIVLPVNTPIRLLTTATDVIHAWAVPAFWIKLDAVPGRINELSFTVDKTGVYYGQCSELCGLKHGFMPIAVEVVSQEKFAEWVVANGGKMPGATAAAKN